MKKLKIGLIIAVFVFAIFAVAGGKSKKRRYIRLDKTSSMKKYNPHAVWQKTECKHCNGTGHKIKYLYDIKKNRTYRRLIPCPYCKGKGSIGMSKK